MAGDRRLLAVELLELDEKAGFAVKDASRDALAGLIHETARKIPNAPSPSRDGAVKILQSIHKTLIEQGYVSYRAARPAPDPLPLDLVSVGLETKILQCVSFAAIYFSIGQEAGIPLEWVGAPSHVFVRWRLGKGLHVNWEAVDGVEHSDEEYVKAYRISKQAIGPGTYMSELDQKGRLGLYFAQLATGLQERRQFERAREYYRRALEANPRWPPIYDNYGVLLETALEDFQGARSNYEKAIELDPGSVTARFALARLLEEKLGKYDEAKAVLDAAIALKPKDAVLIDLHIERGLLLQNRFKKYAEAKLEFERALELNPKSGLAYYNLGKLRFQGFGDRAGAEEYLAKGRSLDPEWDPAWRLPPE